MNFRYSLISGLVASAFCLSAEADLLDRPSGFKIGERMTLRPYVTASLTYDSNVDNNSGSSSGGKEDDFFWSVSPSLWLHYNAETWSLLLSGYYVWSQYFASEHQDQNNHNYGEDLRWNWSNSVGGEKGWSLILGESFRQMTRGSDMTLADGSNYGGDSRQFQLAGTIQRRVSEKVHADLNGSYYWLDYMNDAQQSSSFYGWDRWQVGGEVGWAPSRWTDILLTGAYQGYTQDNMEGIGTSGAEDSRGLSVQGGLGSYMTDRISYRALVGWSQFEYADGLMTQDGFVYTLSGNWKIGETWNTMLLATSYYQPSERQYASAGRTDAVSWGLAKLLVRGSLRATLDVRYRRETHEYAYGDTSDFDYDYTLDIWTGRLGLDYTLNRYLGVYAYGEYQNSKNDHSDTRNGSYDYDRWRVTVGLRLAY